MLATLRQRIDARDERGFTLIELLVVLIIIGVLLAIAIPSYLGFQKSAQQTAAASDVRQAIPDAEAYFADNGSYKGISVSALQTYDSGMQVYGVNGATTGIVSVQTDPTNSYYCISAESNGQFAGVAGPGGTVVSKLTSDPCSSASFKYPSQPGWTG